MRQQHLAQVRHYITYVLTIKETKMFVYSFLEKKNLACVLLFDTVRLLILKGQRFFFNISLKKSKLLSNNVT